MAPQKRGRKTPLKKNKAPAKSLRVGDTGPSSRPRRSCATMTDMDGDKERKSGSPSDVTARAPDTSGVTNGPPSEKRGNMHAAGATRAQAVDHTDTVQNSPKYEAPSTRTRSNVKVTTPTTAAKPSNKSEQKSLTVHDGQNQSSPHTEPPASGEIISQGVLNTSGMNQRRTRSMGRADKVVELPPSRRSRKTAAIDPSAVMQASDELPSSEQQGEVTAEKAPCSNHTTKAPNREKRTLSSTRFAKSRAAIVKEPNNKQDDVQERHVPATGGEQAIPDLHSSPLPSTPATRSSGVSAPNPVLTEDNYNEDTDTESSDELTSGRRSSPAATSLPETRPSVLAVPEVTKGKTRSGGKRDAVETATEIKAKKMKEGQISPNEQQVQDAEVETAETPSRSEKKTTPESSTVAGRAAEGPATTIRRSQNEEVMISVPSAPNQNEKKPDKFGTVANEPAKRTSGSPAACSSVEDETNVTGHGDNGDTTKQASVDVQSSDPNSSKNTLQDMTTSTKDMNQERLGELDSFNSDSNKKNIAEDAEDSGPVCECAQVSGNALAEAGNDRDERRGASTEPLSQMEIVVGQPADAGYDCVNCNYGSDEEEEEEDEEEVVGVFEQSALLESHSIEFIPISRASPIRNSQNAESSPYCSPENSGPPDLLEEMESDDEYGFGGEFDLDTMPDEIHGGYEEMENGDEDMVNGIEDLRSRLIEAIPLYSDRLYRPDQNYANNIGTASVEREGDAAGGSADSLSRPITIEVNKVGEKEARQERSSPDSTLEGFEQEALRRNLRIAQVVEDVAAGHHDEPGNDGNSDGSSSSPRDGEVSEPDGSGALQNSSNGGGPSHDTEQQSIETDPSSPQASGKGRHTGSKRKLPAPSESLLKRAPAKSPERKSSAKPPVRSPTTSANSA